MEEVSVVEIESYFSEYISKVSSSHEKIIITKGNKPVAALIDINDLQQLNKSNSAGGLANVAGKWEGFDEISDQIDEAYSLRKKEMPRDVSL